MNTLMIWIGLSAAFFVTTAVNGIGTAMSRRKNNGKKSFPAFLLACAAGLLVCVIGTATAFGRYRSYGAFYDSSWRDPDVESHFLFDASDTEALQAIYDSDPGNFNTRLYDVILVRLGCEDCESREAMIRAAKEEISARKGFPAYIIFSRSEIGRLYASEYNVTDVPVAIIGGAEIRLADIAG